MSTVPRLTVRFTISEISNCSRKGGTLQKSTISAFLHISQYFKSRLLRKEQDTEWLTGKECHRLKMKSENALKILSIQRRRCFAILYPIFYFSRITIMVVIIRVPLRRQPTDRQAHFSWDFVDIISLAHGRLDSADLTFAKLNCSASWRFESFIASNVVWIKLRRKQEGHH